MAQLGEGGGAFAIPGLFPISSLANLQLEGAASEADRLSPFSTSMFSKTKT